MMIFDEPGTSLPAWS